MDIPFRWWDSDGTVRVTMGDNGDPAYLGCSEIARGFPYCKAEVDFPDRGYASSFGWIPLVKEGMNMDFGIDLRPQFRQEHPFGYLTDRPRFFDGPHTDDANWDFLAHTFLCSLGGELLEFRKEVHAVLGFSWGFLKRDQQIEWFGPEPLSGKDWDSHLEYLTRKYARWWWLPRWRWSFHPGFSRHPLEP
jgi:hypothetical protein